MNGINGQISHKRNDDGTFTYYVDGHEMTTVSREYLFARVTADASHTSGWKLTLSMTGKRGYRPIA